MKSDKKAILFAKGISKYFGGVCALNNVDLELKKGEILGLVGDNGAGKSTLIKIISGVLSKDSGEIYFANRRVEINNPKDAKQLGIETVYQDLALVNYLDIPANIFLGREIKYNNLFGKIFRFINKKLMLKESQILIEKLGINLENLRKEIMYYSGGQRQSVALGKIFYWGRKVAILDEPTAALGVKESKVALELIKNLKKHGLSIIIISHNLQHIFSLVDRIMVLRRGEKVGVVNVHDINADDIVGMITGVKVLSKV